MTIDELEKQAKEQAGVLNVGLFKATAARIRENPDGFDQDVMVICGSACCLAGEVLLAAGMSRKQITRRRSAPLLKLAGDLLGLDFFARGKLFNWGGKDWPKKYKKRYESARSAQNRAEAAASLMEDVATGMVKL